MIMMDTSMHSEPSELERAVHVEACHDGVNPATVVRIVYKGQDAAKSEERTLFDTLEEALAFAQSLCDDETDGH